MVAAITAPEATVIVGGFVLVGTLLQTIVAARGAKKVIGKPNGQGNVIEMLENLLHRQGSISTTVTSLAAQHDALAIEVEEVKRNLLTHMQNVKSKPTTRRKKDP